MARKVPKPFAREIPQKRFSRKILKRIHLDSERDFLLGLYQKGADGRYRRPEEPGSGEIKRLKELARSIRKNKGVVRTGKLSVLLLVVACILLFNFLFKNRLLENALEGGLQRIFEARAEVDDLDLRLLDGRLSIAHLAVADKEEPFRNLFELGRTEVDLRTAELLKGKFVISNLECRDIRWNTPRRTSGALAERGDKRQDVPGAQGAGGPHIALSLPSLDARALVDDQIDKLSSPSLLAALNVRLRELEERWSQAVERGQQDVSRLADHIEEVRSLDIRSLDTLPELQQAVTRIRDAAAAVGKLRQDVQAVSAGIDSDLKEIETARSEVDKALDADLAYLKSFTDPSSGALKNLASSIVAGYLEKILGRYYRYCTRALQYADRLVASRRDRQPAAVRQGVRRSGSNIPFPTRVYPRFLLENMTVSVGARGESRFVQGSVRDISSAPDLIDRPTTFALSQDLDGRQLRVEGMIDRRSRRESDFSLDLGLDNYRVNIDEGLERLGLSSFASRCSFDTGFSLSRLDGSLTGRGLLELDGLQIEPRESGRDPLGGSVYRILRSASRVFVEFDYSATGSGSVQVHARSDIDELLAAGLTEWLAGLGAQYRSELRQELTNRLEAELGENRLLYAAFKDIDGAAGANVSAAEEYERVLDEKKSEVERRIAEEQKKATDAAKSELDKQLEQIREKLPVPKLGF
jgi:uncharacterized protein (TIGR03545 family)